MEAAAAPASELQQGFENLSFGGKENGRERDEIFSWNSENRKMRSFLGFSRES